jgi:hypothetical protein
MAHPSPPLAELGVVGSVAADNESQVLHFVGSINGNRCSLSMDTGATHSFVRAFYVQQHSLPQQHSTSGRRLPHSQRSTGCQHANSSPSQKGGGVPQAPQNAGIGRDVLPQTVGCHMLSHLLWWHVHSSLRMTLITYQTQRLAFRPPPLFQFAEHPYSTRW